MIVCGSMMWPCNTGYKSSLMQYLFKFSILFVIMTSNVMAQKDTIWLNSKWKKTTKENAAYFKAPPVKKDTLYLFKSYYANGEVFSEGTSLSSTKRRWHGFRNFYDAKGYPLYQLNYENNVLEGDFTAYYNGNETVEGQFNQGVLEGSCSCKYGWYRYRRVYKDGKLHGPFSFVNMKKIRGGQGVYENGTITEWKFLINKKLRKEFYKLNDRYKVIGYYDNGNTSFTGTYSEDFSRLGNWIYYFSDGTVKFEIQYPKNEDDIQFLGAPGEEIIELDETYTEPVKSKINSFKTIPKCGAFEISYNNSLVTVEDFNYSGFYASTQGTINEYYTNGKKKVKGQFDIQLSGKWEFWNKEGSNITLDLTKSLLENFDALTLIYREYSPDLLTPTDVYPLQMFFDIDTNGTEPVLKRVHINDFLKEYHSKDNLQYTIAQRMYALVKKETSISNSFEDFEQLVISAKYDQ